MLLLGIQPPSCKHQLVLLCKMVVLLSHSALASIHCAWSHSADGGPTQLMVVVAVVAVVVVAEG